MIQERTNCRTCGSKRLKLILDLGKTPLANDFLSPEEVKNYSTFVPLRVVLCADCSLVQLADTVDPKVLYSRYAYVTSNSKTMDAHLIAQRDHLLANGGFDGKKPRVMEIASNTGLFLQKFKEKGCEVLGVEPARNISEVAMQSGVPTRCEFFTAENGKRIKAEWGAADLILGRHVFAHIDDLKGLLAGLEAVSHEKTLIAFEVPYLVDFFVNTEYDTVYHEHLSYVSVKSLVALTEKTPFFVQRVDHYPIHGGSILFHLRHRGAGVEPHRSVDEAVATENQLHLSDPHTWEQFEKKVRSIQHELPKLLRQLKSQGKRIIGYGASAKGNTLLNTCQLTTKDLDYIIDNTPFKQNKVAPGSWLPIRPPEALLNDQPDYAVILAWNFAPEIIRREQEFQQKGGRFIIPIPEPRIVNFVKA
ncbi:MAG TPA: class I SAM-dependent methyltransferase [Candidatus Saccharimonadales bacterium]|nr:class I SAM-dependent methyltransferase [Candidatus Saccharimonadales bacterium]